jgi:hypothetical protein
MGEAAMVLDIALRVLTALAQKASPDSKDLQELEKLVGPKPGEDELDVFICSVIQRTTKTLRYDRALTCK